MCNLLQEKISTCFVCISYFTLLREQTGADATNKVTALKTHQNVLIFSSDLQGAFRAPQADGCCAEWITIPSIPLRATLHLGAENSGGKNPYSFDSTI